MKISKILLLILVSISFVSCGSFKAKRVDANESDERAMEITDNWLAKDTEMTIDKVMKKIESHRGFKKWLARYRGGMPKVFIAEVQNRTAEAYFPIDDMNNELLNAMSETGEFVLVDAEARNRILEEITYQNDGMVDPKTVKQVGKQTGADLLIFGSVFMKPETRSGKTIKQYSVNIRMTDIEKGIEVFRTRAKVHKYSDQSSLGL